MAKYCNVTFNGWFVGVLKHGWLFDHFYKDPVAPLACEEKGVADIIKDLASQKMLRHRDNLKMELPEGGAIEIKACDVNSSSDRDYIKKCVYGW